ncbi:ABC transporter substrate-binding protein [Paramaledivibacter caminithermalis]|jgi:putative spermidine/putrescine transport system substrate-binding protein|uniref:Putative spermidine/putrescine transport system substrate-binding protein n=1 Tax=Paramaledivibacter caminithermalis (strain DSM 15212 / CIP 107654 / DViRD3) TaxID=1121301 RepID=A0A1M6MYA4_PARC5|nr:ABC transporter substrate-binding protein [Paramaledivibacter caminithermalis]SHJ88402.1 putative spermidine/putrescine transport system substrate-binding protein [Paramaledivibacter caminithermalis DSM 15212]
MKKISIILLMIMLVVNLTACGNNSNKEEYNVLDKEWKDILEDAKGTTVNFYGWGGSQKTNEWLDDFVAKRLKEEYDITFNRVPMNIDDILNKLLGEKQVDVKKGNIDIVWINGENFYTAKNNDLLLGSFTEKLPNFNKYIDKDSPEVKYDFGFAVDGYEAPYGKAQFVMIYDKVRLDKAPKSHEEILEMVKNNPGKFTYPAPPDFTGSAFVRNIIYDIVGYEKFISMEADKERIQKEVAPAMEFLKEIRPYLWKEGKTYPATIAQLDNMFADNEVLMTMSYNPNHVASKIVTGEFPETSSVTILNRGTIGNTHFLTIPYNAPNKAAALVVIDFILSIEAQSSKYDPENWGDLPVIDNGKLNEAEKKIFENIKLGKGTLPQSVLLEHRVPEMPANIIPIIEEIWQENIPVEGE